MMTMSQMDWDRNRDYRADRKKRAIRVFKNVEVLRNRDNLTKTDLAELLGCSQSMYSNWSVGKFVPHDYDTVLKRLSDIFEVSVDDLEDPNFKVNEIGSVQMINVKHEERVVETKIEDEDGVFQSAIDRKKLEIQQEIKSLQLRQQELLEKLKKLEEFEDLMI